MKSRIRMLNTLTFSGLILTAVIVNACGLDALKQNSTAVKVPASTNNISARKAEAPTVGPAPTQSEQLPSDGDAVPNLSDQTLYLSSNSSDGRQRKNLSQLNDAFTNCVGADQLKITQEMLMVDINATNQSLSEGRVRFLLPSIYTAHVGKNILDVEKEFLDIEANRTGVAPDTLEDELYLKALINAANVAAFNCDVKSPSSKCYCSGKVEAEQMLKRCLPLFAPNTQQYQDALNAFSAAENCGAQPANASDVAYLEKRRIAIASLLSSYAFATAK